jgi:PAT family beta-lactamase induction signal transducer AmpG
MVTAVSITAAAAAKGSMKQQRNPWTWVPSISFSQAVPYVAVMMLSTVMYKNLGISNTDLAFYTAWLYLPWVIKP